MDDSRDDHFMRPALAQADLAAATGQTPFGAVVADQAGEAVGSGHNRVRADRHPTAHGEIMALRDAWRRLGERERLATCTLCSSCEACLLRSFVIAQLRIPRVAFAARGTDVATYKRLLDADLSGAAHWINGQQGWAPLAVRSNHMREAALRTIEDFDWG